MGFYDFCKPRLRTASNWSRRVHYADRDSVASATASSKQVHKIEEDKFMNDAFRRAPRVDCTNKPPILSLTKY
ncbi:Oidioi.mRNA.OKI2018_I69.XSR.g15473.t1.cds [Oikopleura dioica]|uniref:Oidioi.mRNA.OKI2018_I69.XSR.g15473.t1.cds n=1 Tax=Oikopleura dioica TaxID=34765 RepID=A0ABN7SI41_OIKDI|nr:Oidioi.mRNA.OKI2018_I69.XSR.g15473.t1.cds [Oikopleura dioica]